MQDLVQANDVMNMDEIGINNQRLPRDANGRRRRPSYNDHHAEPDASEVVNMDTASGINRDDMQSQRSIPSTQQRKRRRNK